LAVLKVRFKYSGLRKIENGQFALFDPNTKRDVDLAQPWSRCFRPGQTVHMSMIFELSTCQDSTCPACHVVNSADDSSEIEWYYNIILKPILSANIN
jgi:hypothetical protein